MTAPRLRPITGTHLYTLPRCARAVALDIAGDRDLRRPLRDEEEFVLARGRAHEAEYVAGLGWTEPQYPRGDFLAGAAATREMLARGVDGVLQGVLAEPREGAADLVGIPDLLRREDGPSELGDFHYVVGDVKSSSRPRGDQILQLSLYAHLLAGVQGRFPAAGFLVMKDGREESIDLAAFRPAFADALDRVRAIRAEPDTARPFLSAACESCRWSTVCESELRSADDLSLVDGMTEGLRSMLETAGVRTARGLARAQVARLARDTHVEGALLRRLSRAAKARVQGAPLAERRPECGDENGIAILHLLRDEFRDRVLAFGALVESPSGPDFVAAIPPDRDLEWAAFERLVVALPPGVKLFHFGRTLRTWFARNAADRPGVLGIENRFVDCERRLRSAASWPEPITDLASLVRVGLGRDPHRAGRVAAAAMWDGAQAESRPCAKLQADLDDLHALVVRWLRGSAGADRADPQAPIEVGG